MLKLFFSKESPIVYAMEAVGVVSLFVLLAKRWWGGRAAITQVLFVVYIAEYIFLRFCTTWKWYKTAPSPHRPIASSRSITYPGIVSQFKYAMVPASYILVITNVWLLSGLPSPMLYFSTLLLAAITHVNVILLYLHFKDSDPTPANYYTRR